MAYHTFNINKIKKQIETKQKAMIRKSMEQSSSPQYIEIGWGKESGDYPDGTPVSQVALIHEFGLGMHEEKAFIRVTKENMQRDWIAMFANLVNKTYERKGSLDEDDKHRILYAIGQKIKADLQKEIVEIDLVDTTRLKNSILIKFRRR